MANRRAEAEHTVYGGGGLDRHLAHKMRIVVVGGAEVDIEPDKGIGVRPVHHLPGDQVFVRDQVFLAVAGNHRDVACAHLLDPAEGLAQRDHVTRFDRLVEQQDEAGNEV